MTCTNELITTENKIMPPVQIKKEMSIYRAQIANVIFLLVNYGTN